MTKSRILVLLVFAFLGGACASAPRRPSGDVRVECGPSPTGKGSEVCRVPAGPFLMGCSTRPMKYNCQEHEMKIRSVELGEFFIDQHEVTVDHYRACVDAGACTEPNSCYSHPIANWKHSDRGDHPVNCVGFRQAVAYCTWVGKRLPTEAEFEKAARGPDGRLFPWGDQEADCRYAAMQDEDGPGCGKGCTSSVCSRTDGNSPYGVCDLAGNLWEWVVDTKGKAFPALDPDGRILSSLRGGAITNSAAVLRSSLRFYAQDVRVPDDKGGDFIGFRCVYLERDYTR